MTAFFETLIGDITDLDCHECDYIIHQANVHNVMGAGVARALVSRWPQVLKADAEAYQSLGGHNHHPCEELLGRVSLAHTDKVVVVNLYAQSLDQLSAAGFPTSYDSAVAGFRALIGILTDSAYKLRQHRGDGDLSPMIRIAIPHGMGCGLGGGSWNIYRAIIEDFANKLAESINLDVYICFVKFQ